VNYFREKGMVDVAISEMTILSGLRKYEFRMVQSPLLVVRREEVLEK
jgi:hypothetical protein